jgi:hypothetical protein
LKYEPTKIARKMPAGIANTPKMIAAQAEIIGWKRSIQSKIDATKKHQTEIDSIRPKYISPKNA